MVQAVTLDDTFFLCRIVNCIHLCQGIKIGYWQATEQQRHQPKAEDFVERM
jgi:hypothetical protein